MRTAGLRLLQLGKTMMGQVLSMQSPPRSRVASLTQFIFIAVAVMSVLVFADRDCRAQSNVRVVTGIDGHYRVGCWTAVRVVDLGGDDLGGDRLDGGKPQRSVLETRDGDGVRVAYEQVGSLSRGDWGYAVPGTEAAPLIIRGPSGILASTRFPIAGSPSRGASMVPSEMPWIVALGDPLGVNEIGANPLLRRDALMAVSMPDRAAGFPDSVLGYQGVDLMMIGGSSRDILRELNDDQRAAMVGWVLGGGRVFLTLGEHGLELLDAAPWLLELLPFEADELTTTMLDPSAIETFTSSQTPLRPFNGVVLPKKQGRTLVTGRTTRRVSVPFAMQYTAGFGEITVIAADLEDELFASWPERLDLITRLTGSILVPRQADTSVSSRATAYDDLAGQMRVTLDQFPIKRTFAFSIVSLILMGLIAAIGPLDYLLVNRLLGRPLLGWLSVPLIAIGLSAVLMLQSTPVVAESDSADRDEDRGLRCNRLEFVDIDATTGLGRGFSASYLYSHPANLIDVDVSGTPALESISAGVDWALTTQFGYPGDSFGGIQIAIEDARLPTYRVSTDQVGDTIYGALRRVPLAPRSSKSLATRFRFSPQLPEARPMARRRGSQLLQGELINPLPIDLLDGMLIYRNWVYLLPTRFPAAARIGAVEDLRQKNFRWQLSRQKSLEENVTETEKWDPAMKDSLARVAEMLMFHDAVGGARYTSLKDDPLSFLDLTGTLTEDRCMLVARVAQPLTRLVTTAAADDQYVPEGETLSMIRLLLPVEAAGSR
jgi:hypothetical protein